MPYFTMFATEEAARSAADELEGEGYLTEMRAPDGDIWSEWTVLAGSHYSDPLGSRRWLEASCPVEQQDGRDGVDAHSAGHERMQTLAMAYGGEHDGC